jgi:hypothetical protein
VSHFGTFQPPACPADASASQHLTSTSPSLTAACRSLDPVAASRWQLAIQSAARLPPSSDPLKAAVDISLVSNETSAATAAVAQQFHPPSRDRVTSPDSRSHNQPAAAAAAANEVLGERDDLHDDAGARDRDRPSAVDPIFSPPPRSRSIGREASQQQDVVSNIPRPPPSRSRSRGPIISLPDPIPLEPASSTSYPPAKINDAFSAAVSPNAPVSAEKQSQESADKVKEASQPPLRRGRPIDMIFDFEGGEGEANVRDDVQKGSVEQQQRKLVSSRSGKSAPVARAGTAASTPKSTAAAAAAAAANSGKMDEDYQCGAYEIGDMNC